MSIILDRDGVDARTSGTFYKSVVKAILLFGSDTWAVNYLISHNMGGFHHRVDRHLLGVQLQLGEEGRW